MCEDNSLFQLYHNNCSVINSRESTRRPDCLLNSVLISHFLNTTIMLLKREEVFACLKGNSTCVLLSLFWEACKVLSRLNIPFLGNSISAINSFRHWHDWKLSLNFLLILELFKSLNSLKYFISFFLQCYIMSCDHTHLYLPRSLPNFLPLPTLYCFSF